MPCRNGKMRSRTMLLNGKELVLGEKDEIPAMEPIKVFGAVELESGSCAFFLVQAIHNEAPA